MNAVAAIVAPVAHIDPAHPAVAFILAYDLDGRHDHEEIVKALAPHVAAAPALREWSEDDEYTPAEGALDSARLFVDAYAEPVGSDPWIRGQTQLDNLRRCQRRHRASVVEDRIGSFPSHYVHVDSWHRESLRVGVYRTGILHELQAPLLEFYSEPTRREVEVGIQAWTAGHERGRHEGAEQVRAGIKSLLQIDAD